MGRSTHRHTRASLACIAVTLLLFQVVATAFVCRAEYGVANVLGSAQRLTGVCRTQAAKPVHHVWQNRRPANHSPVNRSHDAPVQHCPVCQGLTGHLIAILASSPQNGSADISAQSYLASRVVLPSGAETAQVNNRGPPALLV
jgi:hypothetical protein